MIVEKRKEENTMKINNQEITAKKFANAANKFYLIEDEEDLKQALAHGGYEVYEISKLKEMYQCSEGNTNLSFINNWKLDKNIAPQFSRATFED